MQTTEQHPLLDYLFRTNNIDCHPPFRLLCAEAALQPVQVAAKPPARRDTVRQSENMATIRSNSESNLANALTKSSSCVCPEDRLRDLGGRLCVVRACVQLSARKTGHPTHVPASFRRGREWHDHLNTVCSSTLLPGCLDVKEMDT